MKKPSLCLFTFFNSLFTSIIKPGCLWKFIFGNMGFGNGFICYFNQISVNWAAGSSDKTNPSDKCNTTQSVEWQPVSRVKFPVFSRGFIILTKFSESLGSDHFHKDHHEFANTKRYISNIKRVMAGVSVCQFTIVKMHRFFCSHIWPLESCLISPQREEWTLKSPMRTKGAGSW